MNRVIVMAIVLASYLFLAVPQAFASVVINEVFPNPSGDSSELGEWIELYNSGSDSIDLGGWRLSDDGVTTYTIASGSSISAGGFLTFEKAVTNIALNNSGDTVRLYDTPDHVVDAQSYASIADDKSVGRSSDGGGSWVLCSSPTKATSNTCPLPTVTPTSTISPTQTTAPIQTPTVTTTNTPAITPTKTLTPTTKPKTTILPTVESTPVDAGVLGAGDERIGSEDDAISLEAFSGEQKGGMDPLIVVLLFVGSGFGLLTIAAVWHNIAIWQKLFKPKEE